MKQALILVDIQNDYFPGGRWELDGMQQAASKARVLLDTFRDDVRFTLHVQHVFDLPDPPFFAAGSEGVELHESIAPQADEEVLIKNNANAFRDTNLLEILEMKDIERVVVCGAMSHMCVEATARAAADHDLEVVVVHDACATRAVEFGGQTIPAGDVHTTAMATLSFGYAEVLSLDEYLARP